MSEQNVQAVQKIYDAFNQGQIGYILDQLADDVSWVSRLEGVVPWSGDYSSRAKVPAFFQRIADSVEVLGFAPGDFVAQGDTVVSVGEFGCRVKATGKEAHTRWIFVWKLKDGRVTSYEQFHEPALAEAFRA